MAGGRTCPVCDKRNLVTEVRAYYNGLVLHTCHSYLECEKYCWDKNLYPAIIRTVSVCKNCSYEKVHSNRVLSG